MIVRKMPRGSNLLNNGISRRNFIFLLLLSVFSLGFIKKGGRANRKVIRPPAALDEDKFINRCIRCGNCMKVCLTNGLQPVLFQSGLGGIWTPNLVPEIGYCEYKCTLCGNTCPTGAIRRVSPEEKLKIKLGIARIDMGTCLPWAEGKECIVCEEHCPVSKKAIKLKKETKGPFELSMPYVDEKLCVGCGICQNKCPVRPIRAIRVFPI